jgi:hypothetical protein
VKRVVALIAALAMVTVAFGVRAVLDEGDDDTTADGGSDAAGRVVCVTELGPVCEVVAEGTDLRVEVAPYTETMALLGGAGDGDDLGVAAWVAPAPMVGMVADERARSGLPPVLGDPGEPVARSPLVLVAWDDRLAALEGTCGPELSWSCVGEVADVPWSEVGGEATWGRVKPGHAAPDTSAVGLLVAGQATADRLGTPAFASNDFVEPGFRTWFTQLEQAVAAVDQPGGAGPLDRMIGLGPAAYDVVGTTEAEALPQVARSARYGDRLTVLYPSPTTTVDVVVAPVLDPGGLAEAGDAVAGRFRSDTAVEAFSVAGWRVPGRPVGELLDDTGLADLPDDDGTASPGALTALLDLWEEIT